MNSVTIKLVCNKYNKLLSRAESYLKEVRQEEQEYYSKYYMNSSLIPSSNKIICCKKVDCKIVLTLKNSVNINSFCIFLKTHLLIQNLQKKMFYNKIIIC